MTRVNVGRAEAGLRATSSPNGPLMEAEVRGETTELMEYVKTKLERVSRSAARMHGCEAEFEVISECPRADSDPELVDVVAAVADGVPGVERVVPTADFARERGRDLPSWSASRRTADSPGT